MSDGLWNTEEQASGFASRYVHAQSFKRRLVVWNKLIDTYCKPQSYCIDAGCGTGAISQLLLQKGMRVFAFDGSSELLQLAEKSLIAFGNQAQFRLLQLPLADRSQLPPEKADLIVCSSVLEYVEDVEAALSDFRFLLNDQGYLILSVPNQSSLLRLVEKTALKQIRPDTRQYLSYVKHQFSDESARQLFTKVGFSVVGSEYFGIFSTLYKLGIREDQRVWGTMIAFVLQKA